MATAAAVASATAVAPLAPGPVAVPTAPPVAQGLASPAPPTGVSPDLPLAELLSKREEDPSPASPLTYRETAWVVPEGTSVDAAVRLLAGMFEGVRAVLTSAKPGKLVNMAIFDHRFQGKPRRPPLATLTWKDWKDTGQGPEIRRPGDPLVSMLPPQLAGASLLPAMPASVPLASPVIPAPPPVPASLPVLAAAPPVTAAPAIARSAPLPVAVAAPVAAVPPVTAVAPEATPAVVAEPTRVAAPALDPLSAALASSNGVVVPPSAFPAPAAPEVPAPAAVEPIRAPQVAAPVPLIAPAPRASTPSSPRNRLSGDELIADLFEAMHDLHFLRDALEGADFVLSLVMDKLPCTIGLVHFYDINAREFVVVRAIGPGAKKALGIRTNEKEALIAEAMRKRRSVVIEDAANDSRAQRGRWALIDNACRSLVCAPVEQGGRFLGLLELSNPRDGGPFGEGDGHALTYLGEQFAEFLAARAVMLDPDRLVPSS